MVELGETRLASLEERSTDAVQRAVCASGAAMGRYLTPIERVQWLKQPVQTRGSPGIFEATIPRDALPDGWTLPVE